MGGFGAANVVVSTPESAFFFRVLVKNPTSSLLHPSKEFVYDDGEIRKEIYVWLQLKSPPHLPNILVHS
jgi:hypothetical protein